MNAKQDQNILPQNSVAVDSTASWDTNSTSPFDQSTSATSQSWDEAPGDPGMHVASELDFALIWPDSENLFQSLMSSDTTDQWQMPLGTLPFPPVVQDVNGMSFGSPISFDDRSSSIGALPMGGGHQAVQDVTEMVTSSVSQIIDTYNPQGTHWMGQTQHSRVHENSLGLTPDLFSLRASLLLSRPHRSHRCFSTNVCICSSSASYPHSRFCTAQHSCSKSARMLFF